MPVDVLPWDPSLGANPGASAEINRGCPVGYFAMDVAPDFPGATPTSPGNALVCRLVATSNATTIQSESGMSWQETYQRYLDAVKATIPTSPGGAADPFGWLTGPMSSAGSLVLLGIAALVLWETKGTWRRP